MTIAFSATAVLLADDNKLFDMPDNFGLYIIGGAVVFFFLIFLMLVLTYGKLWFQAYMSNARVSLLSLVGMSLRKVDARVIVQAKIMALQAGVGTDPHTGITTRRLEAHYLAGGDVPRVIRAIIAAQRADIDLISTAPPPSTWPAATCSTPCKRASIRR